MLAKNKNENSKYFLFMNERDTRVNPIIFQAIYCIAFRKSSSHSSSDGSLGVVILLGSSLA